MKISKVSVKGLFGRFNHDLLFSPADPITIMIGPNGFGKTMMLKILNALFNSTLQSLRRLPFEELEIFFDDSSTLKATRILGQPPASNINNQPNLKIQYLSSKDTIESITSEDMQIDEDNLPFAVDAIEDIIPVLDQIGPSQWRNLSTRDILDLNDVMAEFGDQLPSPIDASDPMLGWLHKLRQAMPVRFTGIERLTYSPRNESRRNWMRHSYLRFPSQPQRRVRYYSSNLANMVEQKLSEYGNLSQSLDRTFPVRLMEEPTAPALSADEVMLKLTEVEQKRSRIVEAGLLRQEDEGISGPVVQSVDESSRSVLAVYVQDALRKLSIFDDLYARVNTFKRIANDRFLYKRVSVGFDGLTVAALDGSELELEMLSSGEQHELVLLYDLLFGVAPNSLIMIDEPELSLHVAWQDELLSDLNEMAALSDYRILLATHSPQIIGDRWDLAVELKGPDET